MAECKICGGGDASYDTWLCGECDESSHQSALAQRDEARKALAIAEAKVARLEKAIRRGIEVAGAFKMVMASVLDKPAPTGGEGE